MNKNDNWAVEQAKLILKNLAKNKTEVNFETGYGPSGLPHFGTFAEVARTTFIMAALQELAPNLKLNLYSFSDDRDGLRKLPPNIPNHDMLRLHMGKPLSLIPDPFGEQKTFADYMNTKLKSFLDQFGFKYNYISSTDFYLQGKLDQVMKLVCDHYEEISATFIKTMKEENRQGWSPFLPICPNCQKLYTTYVTNVDKVNYRLDFHCSKESPFYQPCGYKGSCDIKGEFVKLGWKIDWSARWLALDIDFEPHGEDLTESVNVSRKICKILGFKGPITFKYELFVDENGMKISKTKGNGLSMDQWLRYAPLNSLIYFLTSTPNRSKRMGLSILPKLIDDYLQAEKDALNQNFTLQDNLWYVRLYKPAPQGVENFIPYRLLVNIIESVNANSIDLLLQYANKYNEKLTANLDFNSLCEMALKFVVENKLNLIAELTIQVEYVKYLIEFKKYLVDNSLLLDNETQNLLFKIATDANIPLKDWFKFLYNVYLQQNEGPKIGHLFSIIGRDNTLQLTNKILTKYLSE